MSNQLVRRIDAPNACLVPEGSTYEAAFLMLLERGLYHLGLKRGLPLLDAFYGSLVYATLMVLKRQNRALDQMSDAERIRLYAKRLFLEDVPSGEGYPLPFTRSVEATFRLIALGLIDLQPPDVTADRCIERLDKIVCARLDDEAASSTGVSPSGDLVRFLALEVFVRELWTPALRRAFIWSDRAFKMYEAFKGSLEPTHTSGWAIPITIAYDESHLGSFDRVRDLVNAGGSVSVLQAIDIGRQLALALEDQQFWLSLARRYPKELLRGARERCFKDTVVNTELLLAIVRAPMTQRYVQEDIVKLFREVQPALASLRPGNMIGTFWKRLEAILGSRIPVATKARYASLISARLESVKRDIRLADSPTYRRNDLNDLWMKYTFAPSPTGAAAPSSHPALRVRDLDLEELRNKNLSFVRLDQLVREWVEAYRPDVEAVEDSSYHRSQAIQTLQKILNRCSRQYQRIGEPFTPLAESAYVWMIQAAIRYPTMQAISLRGDVLLPAIEQLLETGKPPEDGLLFEDRTHHAYMLQSLRLLDGVMPNELQVIGAQIVVARLLVHATSLARLLVIERWHQHEYDGKKAFPRGWEDQALAAHPWIALAEQEQKRASFTPRIKRAMREMLKSLRTETNG